MKISLSLFAALAVLLVVVAIGQPSGASAATITVDTTNDELNSDGDCSLREAITAANSDAAVDACTAGSGADTISLPAGTYKFLITGAGEDLAATGDLDITESLTITGAGKATTIIDAADLDRAFDVDPAGSGITVSISDLKIENGKLELVAPDDGHGGAIYVAVGASLTLADALLEDNWAKRAGGAVFNAGTLTVLDSEFSNNATPGDGVPGQVGGGAIANDGTLVVERSDFTTNDAGQGLPAPVPGFGGAIDNRNGATATIKDDSSFTSNRANGGYGGGIANEGTLTVTFSTFLTNDATVSGSLGEGGGIETTTGTVTVEDTVFDGNLGGIGGGIRDQSGVTTLLRVTVKNHSVGIYFEDGGADQIINSTVTNNAVGVHSRGSSPGGGVTITDDSTITGNTIALSAGSSGPHGAGFIEISDSTLAANTTICSGHIWDEDLYGPPPAGEPALRIHDLGGNDVANTDGDLAFDPCDPCPYGITAGIEVGVPPDEDCDGFGSTTKELGRASESFLGTDDDALCSADTTPNNESPDAWPVDLNDDQVVNTLDSAMFIPLLNSQAPGPPYDARFDLNDDDDGGGAGWINVFDVAKLIPFLNKSCSP